MDLGQWIKDNIKDDPNRSTTKQECWRASPQAMLLVTSPRWLILCPKKPQEKSKSSKTSPMER